MGAAAGSVGLLIGTIILLVFFVRHLRRSRREPLEGMGAVVEALRARAPSSPSISGRPSSVTASQSSSAKGRTASRARPPCRSAA